MKKIIEKLEANFKLASLGLLIFIALVAMGTGYSVWSNSTGTVYPGPAGISWPSVDKGYVGDPTDVMINQDANLVGNESIYNMLGKTWYQNANNDSGICGVCNANNTEFGYSTGCCKVISNHGWDKNCAPESGFVMAPITNLVNNQYGLPFFCFKPE